MFGDKLFDNVGFPTPESIPEGVGCRSFTIPDDTAWYAVVMGCLMLLTEEANWQQFSGGLTPEEAAEVGQQIFDSGYASDCAAATTVPTPYWDNDTDVDDQSNPVDQTWYGYVDDPELPPDELTFIENAGIWAFSGFLAISGTPAAAILFNTIAPSFVLAMRGDDLGEVIRVIVDGYEQATVDTTGLGGAIVEVPITGDPDQTTHSILLIKSA